MEEMIEVVIRIPKEQYENGSLVRYFGCYSKQLDKVIYEGTVLPKGHGIIVDANRLKKDVYIEFNRPVDSMWTTREELDEKTIISIIDNAPTIIEADRRFDYADSN